MRRRLVSPTTRKRAEFVVAALTFSGDVHYQRWPERSALGKTRYSKPQSRKKYGSW